MADKQPAHVEQALTELAGTASPDQVLAARKRLAAAGYELADKDAEEARPEEPAETVAPVVQAAPKGRRPRTTNKT